LLILKNTLTVAGWLFGILAAPDRQYTLVSDRSGSQYFPQESSSINPEQSTEGGTADLCAAKELINDLSTTSNNQSLPRVALKRHFKIRDRNHVKPVEPLEKYRHTFQ
jgi:hypothetical protein